MPNPRPRQHTTGNFLTREGLRATVHLKRSKKMDWTTIGRQTGTSARTAKRLYAEEEELRRAARELAYEQGRSQGLSISGQPERVTFDNNTFDDEPKRWPDIAFFCALIVGVIVLLYYLG